MQILLNGAEIDADLTDSLTRAVIISLFSWRRAEDSDDVDSSLKYGWWADQFGTDTNDRIGSRLWELMRSKLTDETTQQAEDYVNEALQWMTDDGLCQSVEVSAERSADDINRMDMSLIIHLAKSNLKYEFKDFLNANA